MITRTEMMKSLRTSTIKLNIATQTTMQNQMSHSEKKNNLKTTMTNSMKVD
jgi:hypothetical protein